jgi:hypothetical protein
MFQTARLPYGGLSHLNGMAINSRTVSIPIDHFLCGAGLGVVYLGQKTASHKLVILCVLNLHILNSKYFYHM